jgi:hypothetical protein
MARKVENLNVGSTFYYNRSKCHVVGFCNTFEDGEAVVLIVYKYWLKYRKYWKYGVVEGWILQMWFDEQGSHKPITRKAKKMNTDFILNEIRYKNKLK